MLFSAWIASAYNAHNITYPVKNEDCADGYVPMAVPAEQTIPGENGILSIVKIGLYEG